MPGNHEPPITIVDEASGTIWNFDRAFLASNWKCLFGNGCQGILDRPAEELHQGCCSVGAELDNDEARTLSAMAAMIDPGRFQFHAEASETIFGPESRDGNGWRTRLVDDACIFLNRPGFSTGPGCALHFEALAQDEPPIDWKPSVCWQLPIHVNWTSNDDGSESVEVRAWQRADWGSDGETMAWCCTEEPDAYIGEHRVIDSLASEIEAVTGGEVLVELVRRLR